MHDAQLDLRRQGKDVDGMPSWHWQVSTEYQHVCTRRKQVPAPAGVSTTYFNHNLTCRRGLPNLGKRGKVLYLATHVRT